jgi:hypothetical protein
VPRWRGAGDTTSGLRGPMGRGTPWLRRNRGVDAEVEGVRAMTERWDATAAQMSLDHPDLVPGDQVRFPHRRGWRFGVLVGFDGIHAVISTSDGGRPQRVPAGTVSPWPPPGKGRGPAPVN